ncbi:hypothetical protein, partial [Buttiauxella noackiae]|uniref:hypothetical protein n=1 Tax=Buttiauxella noackiae TaxID=82992 RepID=UPI001ADF5EC7
MKLAHCLPNFFITDTITQTNVHKHSRSNYAQSVNENSYDYNSTRMLLQQVSGKNCKKKERLSALFSYKS